MDAPASPHRKRPACRRCGQPLTALRSMTRDVCERASCMQEQAAQDLQAARDGVVRALRQAQAPTLGGARAGCLRVVWIASNECRLVDLPDPVRQRMVDHLQQLVAAEGAADSAPAEPPAQAAAVSTAQGALCGLCAGQCCRYGGPRLAFIELQHLRRWQVDHAAPSLHLAVAAYVARLPQRHVEDSCAFHGERGCTLDRTMRSDICNRYACDALREVQGRESETSGDDWLLVKGDRAEASSWALQLAPDAPAP